MAYTVHQMMAHAELHLATAQKQLEYADGAEDDGWNAVCCARASAEAQAGLLALELARERGGT